MQVWSWYAVMSIRRAEPVEMLPSTEHAVMLDPSISADQTLMDAVG